MNRLDPIEDQRLQIAINNNANGDSQGDSRSAILPYDPSNPPDNETSTIILAINSLDNSDFDYSKKGYLGAGTADEDEECYNFYRQRLIKAADVVTTAASNTITSASNPFSAAYTYPMDFVLYNGGASGAALVGYINRNGADNSAKLYSDAGLATPLNVTPTLTAALLWFGTSLAENATNALKSSGHSTFAANEGTNTNIPRWDRTNGWVEMGSNAADHFDLATPLPINLIRAGVTYWFRCIVSQRSGTSGSGPVRISAGIWDATAGQQRFIEGSNFDLTVLPVGTTGATSYQYVVLADLDDGRTVVSDTVTVANGNAVLSASNYNRLEWQNMTGVIRFRIYRKVGGVTKRVFTITNGAHDFNDTGSDEGETPANLPTAGEERAIAYSVSPEFDPEDIGIAAWTAVLIPIYIPGDYNSGSTTGKQWLRVQAEGLTHDVRMALSDRWSLSTSNGGWNRSARDLNKIATGAPSSTPPDDGGQGGGGIDDDQRDGCFVPETPVIVCQRSGVNLQWRPIGDIRKGDYVFSGSNRVFKVTLPKKSRQTVIRIILSNQIEFIASPTERFITSRADKRGTLLRDLTLGDEILCWTNGRVSRETIETYEYQPERVEVITLSLKGGHTFVAGRNPEKPDLICGAIAHNAKIIT